MTNLTPFLIPAAAAFLTALVGTALALVVARRRRLLDVPNERSSHTVPTPRSGGVAIVAGIVVGLFVSGFGDPLRPSGLLLGAAVPSFPAATLVAIVIACLVGLWDDIRPLSAVVKMGGVVLAALVAEQSISILNTVADVPYAGIVSLGRAGPVLFALWLACYPNAFNFMDGINGIAALTAAVSGAAFALAGAGPDPALAVLGAATAAAALGFLPWNFPRANIFMGDAGSLPLGLALALCAVRANESGALPFPASVLLLGPFLFDVAFTLVRRGIEGKRIGEAHKEHLYQRLSRLWGSHAKVSLLYAGFAVLTGSLALIYRHLGDTGRLLSLVLPLAAMLGFAALVSAAERKKGP